MEELTPLQKDLNLPDKNYPKEHQRNILHTHFSQNLKRGFSYSHFQEKLDRVYDELSNEITYNINMNNHGLLYPIILQKLPKIILKKPEKHSDYVKYEAKWINNLLLKILEKCFWENNGKTLQTFDTVFLDFYIQSMIKEEEKKYINEDIGNKSKLQTWCEKINSDIISFLIPWSYTQYGTIGENENIKKFNNFLPLYFFGLLDKITHKFILNRNIKDLLQIRGIKKDGTWDYVNFSKETISQIDSITDFKEDIKLSLPDMYGEYILMTKEELEIHYGCDKFQMHNILFIDDIIEFDPEDELILGNKKQFDIKNIDKPIHTYMWGVQNIKNLKNKNYSNYTLDVTRTPIENTSINNGYKQLFTNVPSYFTEHLYPSLHFTSRPNCEGMNYWTTGLNSKHNYMLPASNIKNGFFEIKLIESEDDINEKFLLKVRMIYLKKITITSFPKNEKERESFQSTIAESW